MQYASQVAPAARIARLTALLAVALVAVIAALAPSADAYSIKQWTFKYSGAPSTNAPFSLYNQDTQDEVRYGERSCGINLVWSPGTTREWRLRRANGSTGPLRFGERLALRNDTVAAYMNYRSRDCGINLLHKRSERHALSGIGSRRASGCRRASGKGAAGDRGW